MRSSVYNVAKRLERQKDELLKERDSEIQLLKKQLELVGVLSKSKSLKIPIYKQTHRDEATAFAIGSDWHIEEEIDPKTVNNRNKYNLNIADARIDNFFNKIVLMTNWSKTLVDIPRLVVGLLGDLLSGYIHDESEESNVKTPPETVILLFHKLLAGFRFLLTKGNYARIDVVCCCGNHGRTTKKRRTASFTRNSFEWLLYQMLAYQFKDEKTINFHIADGQHEYLEVYEFTFRFQHGCALRYQGGIGGLYIPVGKAIPQWNKIRRADYDVFAHFHQAIDGGNWISNGSLIGFSPYALDIKASFEPPQQQFFLVAPKRGKILTAPLFVEKEKM